VSTALAAFALGAVFGGTFGVLVMAVLITGKDEK